MRELNQSENYDETGFDEDGEMDEADEDTSTHPTTIMGIPMTGFIIGVAVILIVIVLLVVVATRKNSGSSDDDIIYAQNPASNGVTQVFSNFEAVGYINSASPQFGDTIISLNGGVYGVLAEAGNTLLTDDMGKGLGYVTLTETATPDTSSSTSSSQSLIYTEEQVKELRKYGYTGDEIEFSSANSIQFDALIEEAQLLQDEAAKEALARMSDSASEEFQSMVSSTQYCMPYQEYHPAMLEEEGYLNYTGSYIVNADYEKIPTYGYQLRIKVKIANGTYVFMDMSPGRYGSLPDTGNIVVEVQYTKYGNLDHYQLYITDIIERDITTLTVNPEDSGVNLDDAIQ